MILWCCEICQNFHHYKNIAIDCAKSHGMRIRIIRYNFKIVSKDKYEYE